MSFKVKQVTRTKVTPSLCLRPKQATLNLVATLNRWESAPPALYKGPTTGFSDWISMLEANAWGRWHEQEDKSWIESKCNRSLFFSRNPVVSYVTWFRTKKKSYQKAFTTETRFMLAIKFLYLQRNAFLFHGMSSWLGSLRFQELLPLLHNAQLWKASLDLLWNMN